MCPVVHQPRNILLGHFRQLLLKYALETGENLNTLSGAIVVDHMKLDVAATLLGDGRLRCRL